MVMKKKAPHYSCRTLELESENINEKLILERYEYTASLKIK